ncbi:MAG: hypothetical protein ACKVP0_23360 [Pirellulaceae bacterium]
MSANPYHPPQPVATQVDLRTSLREDSDMSLRKATLYVAATTLASASVGCLVGAGIGTIAPEYYRFLFRAAQDADFHPAAVGGSMGLIQGGGVGLAVGVLLVVIHCWYTLRLLRLRLKME